MSVGIPVLGLVSHTRKVQSLYKRVLRNLENYYDKREVYRYHAVIMRAEFDKNKDIKDIRVARELLHQGEENLFQKMHPIQKKFPESPGGVAYGREVPSPDWVLDYWHPLEKAQYPEYFAKREEMKKEYVKLWEKLYKNVPDKKFHN
ncbi:NADH dehydrogenase [ubiquinone] 1 beta subcomplex subunit 9 [Coccinella septempunctata]|uniref:NADH dehydrogenase [ubiquinone] 1 beta subcomplex subunit 9 n=1 Tax=Coccinella septempunctata TaxID=41139 RepID=UPI001D092385|nr:NADH dehydrogenase [ubiquinone] 1 beta subcomplex subunit 9 [Coccinella septempunctata]